VATWRCNTSLDDFQDNEDGLRTVILTAMRTEGDKEIIRSCALDIVLTPRLTGGMTGAVQPGSELTFTLKIFDYKLFTNERPQPMIEFLYGNAYKDTNIELSEPTPSPDVGKEYQGYSTVTGTVKLDENGTLPTRAVSRISGQMEYDITTSAEWAIELARQPEPENSLQALQKRWGWLFMAFFVGLVISKLTDPSYSRFNLIIRFLKIKEKGKIRNFYSGEKDTVYTLFLLTITLFCTIIPFFVNSSLGKDIQTIEAWIGIAGLIFSVIAGGLFAGLSTILLGVSLDKDVLRSSLKPIQTLLGIFKEEIRVCYYLSLFWSAWFFIIYPFGIR